VEKTARPQGTEKKTGLGLGAWSQISTPGVRTHKKKKKKKKRKNKGKGTSWGPGKNAPVMSRTVTKKYETGASEKSSGGERLKWPDQLQGSVIRGSTRRKGGKKRKKREKKKQSKQGNGTAPVISLKGKQLGGSPKGGKL